MQKILLINPYEPPSKRKVVKKGVKKVAATKRRRTSAQIAATKRMLAANKKRRVTRVKRRKNPIVGGGDAAAYRSVPTMRQNPIRRRRRATTAKTAAASTVRRFTRRRKNPIKPTLDILQNSIGGALWGAGGAVAVDMVTGMLPLPDMFKSGYPKFLLKGLLSGLAGVGAGYVVDRKTAAQIASGGLTVNLYGALVELVKESMPGVSLGYYNASLPATRKNLGAYVSGTKGAGSSLQASAPGGGMGAYVSGARNQQHGRLRAVR